MRKDHPFLKPKPRQLKPSARSVRSASAAKAVRNLIAGGDLAIIAETLSRLTLLNDATQALSSSLEYEAVLQHLAEVVVPTLADWCSINMVAEDGSIKRVAVVHPDREKVKLALALQKEYPATADGDIGEVVRTGKSTLTPEIPESLMRERVTDLKLRKILKALGLTSAMMVPIVDRGQVFGVMSLIAAESGRHFSQGDLELAEDIGRRAGAAVHNSLLYRKIQEDDKRKDHFLSILAHELRNPLTPLLHSLELMKLHGMEDHDMESALQVATRQAKQMGALLKSLLDVTRALHGKIELDLATIDAGTIVWHAIETAEPLIKAGKQVLTVDVPKRIFVDADPLRLEQILVNLLSNAAKYTHQGGHIAMSVRAKNGMAEFHVRDTGAGIEPHMISSIFDLFVQSEQSLSRFKGGLGIGLRLARMLAELHGGTLIARSAGAGKGSEFVLRIPLAKSLVKLPKK